jgi:hypothetical protein
MITNAGKAYERTALEANHNPFYGVTLYMALGTDATVPALGDTTIVGEQTTAGLGRAAVTVAHTGGTNIWSFTNVFTYTGSTPVNVYKVAIFDAASAGNLIAEFIVPLAAFASNGDNATFVYQFGL